MLDVLYVALILALFALTGLVATAVEKMGPRARGSAPRAAMDGEEQR